MVRHFRSQNPLIFQAGHAKNALKKFGDRSNPKLGWGCVSFDRWFNTTDRLWSSSSWREEVPKVPDVKSNPHPIKPTILGKCPKKCPKCGKSGAFAKSCEKCIQKFIRSQNWYFAFHPVCVGIQWHIPTFLTNSEFIRGHELDRSNLRRGKGL